MIAGFHISEPKPNTQASVPSGTLARIILSEARRASSDISGMPPRAMTASVSRRTRSGVKSSRRRSRPSGWKASSGLVSSSDNARLAFSPVAVPDQPLVELAGRMARQLRVEIDRPRTFDRGKARAAIGDQFLGELRRRVLPVQRLHHRLHFLAEILVRHADDRDVGDSRMGDQEVLRFLRIDVDAYGNDHEGLAVGEVEIAVGVELADIAQRRPFGVLGMAGLGGLLGIVVIGELRGGGEVDRALLADRKL